MYRGECNITHGGSKTRLYRIWKQMRIRCRCSTNPSYRYYGARGISICDEWDDFASFREWALSHGYSDDMSIDRINPDGNYEPSNCRWIPHDENCKYKRSNRVYSFGGKTMTHNDWAREIGISPSTLTERIRRHGLEFSLSAGKRIERLNSTAVLSPLGGQR